MRRQLLSLMFAGFLAGTPMLVGCERELAHEEETKVRSDGTSVREETTVKERDDGTIVKEKERSVDRSPDRD